MEIFENINICFIVIALILLGSAIKGYHIGMIQSISSFIGIIFAFIALIIFVITANAYIGKNYSQILIGVVSLIIVILVHRIVGFIFSSLKLLSKISVIAFVDRILGLFVGIIEGIVDFWIIGIVLIAFGTSEIKNFFLVQVMENEVLNLLFNNNIIAMMISKI